jgi:sensor domain CHASE-containing protein
VHDSHAILSFSTFPAVHVVQIEAADEEIFPVLQDVHWFSPSAPWYFPAAQSSQDVMPWAEAIFPTPHAKQDAWPSLLVAVPVGQGSHEVALPLESA